MTPNRRRRSSAPRRTTAASAVATVLGLLLLLVGSWLLAGLRGPSAAALGRGQWVSAAAAADGRGGDVVAPAVRSRIQREGRARVMVELRTPTGVRPESELPLAGVILQRNDIAVIGNQVLARLAGRMVSALHKYETVPLMALEVGADALAELEASTFWVARVLEDEVHAPGLSQSGPLVGADQAWARGFNGSGWVVAILDTGVDAAHPFFSGRVAEQACFSSNVAGRSTSVCPNGQSSQVGSNSARPCSLSACWHGTHVAGIAAGNGPAAGQSFSGVARGAQIMAIQVFSSFTQASDCGSPPCALSWTSDFLAGLEHVYTRRTAYNIASANLSLGGGTNTSTCDGSSVKPAIDNLRSAGIATVISAGNNSSVNAISSPACISTAISVGATNKNDTIASYSNLSFFTSLLAPGTSITSSFPGTGYGGASGTSMAAPHVTGTWAVLKQAVPNASVSQILAALQSTGLPIADTRSGGSVTKSRIRIAAALDALSPSPTLGVSPASVAAGGSVTASWAGITSASASDWIGLYAPSAANTGFISRIYVGCGASPGGVAVPGGSCPFPVPGSVTPGGYELRLFSNNTFTRLATSGPLTVTSAPVTLSASPASVAAGASATATWSGITGPTSGDWIGLYAPSAVDTAYLARVYVGCGASPSGSGAASGSCPFPIPTTLSPGTYQLRLFANNGFTRVATSGNFSVTPATSAALSASPASVVPGGSLTATWSGIPAPSAADWIGLYAPGSSNAATLARIFVGCGTNPSGSGVAAGSCPFPIPGVTAPGSYQLRLFANSGALLATSANFTVTASVVTSLSVSPTSVVAGGSVTASWSGIGSPSSGDWIGLYTPGSANASFVSRIYVGCGGSPSGSGAASGSCAFPIGSGVSAGTYQLRLLASNGVTLLATSGNFTVTAPVVTVLSVSPSSVVASGSVTASWSGIGSPSSGDSIGLYTPGSANASFISRIYVGCGASPSGSGAASGSCAFPIGAGVAAGTYQLRLFANSGFTLLATSGNFTVTAPSGTTVSASPTSVARGGTVTATWSGIANPKAGDWIGIFAPGASYLSYVSWMYVSCAQVMTSPRASGSCAMSVPAGIASGTYQIRLFSNNTYGVIGTSNAFTVAP